MPIYRFEDSSPSIASSAFIHPSAEIIGDVIIEANCYIAPGAVLRGDFGRIHVQHHSNIQDNCVLHSFPNQDCIVSAYGHVGHAAVLHGCILDENVLVGMNSVVMDQSHIAQNSIIAANSLVPAKFSCEPGMLIMGSPAKVKRLLSDSEITWKSEGTQHYIQLAQRYHKSCVAIDRADLATQPTEKKASASAYQFKPDASE